MQPDAPPADGEELKRLNDERPRDARLVQQSNVNYFLDNNVYSCFPLSSRIGIKVKQFFTCRTQQNFVDELAIVMYTLI